jgi:hypothetical protein
MLAVMAGASDISRVGIVAAEAGVPISELVSQLFAHNRGLVAVNDAPAFSSQLRVTVTSLAPASGCRPSG